MAAQTHISRVRSPMMRRERMISSHLDCSSGRARLSSSIKIISLSQIVMGLGTYSTRPRFSFSRFG